MSLTISYCVYKPLNKVFYMTYLLKGYQVKIYAISNFYLMLTLSLDYM